MPHLKAQLLGLHRDARGKVLAECWTVDAPGHPADHASFDVHPLEDDLEAATQRCMDSFEVAR